MTSGTISGTTNNKYITARIQWSESSVNNVSNTSVVTATFALMKSSSSTAATTGTLNYSLTINGNTKSGSVRVTLNANNQWVGIVSHSVTVTHNSDGSKSISIGASAGISGTTFTSTSCSATVALSVIPRQAAIDSFSASKEYIDSTTTFTVKYTPKTTGYYYKLRMSIPSVVAIHKVNIGAISSTSQQTKTDTFTYAEIISLLNDHVTSAGEMIIGAVIETYADSSYSTKIGESSELKLTMTIPDTLTNGSSNVSLLPTLGTFTISRVANGVPSSITDYVQGYTKVTVSYGATAVQGAAVKSYTIEITDMEVITVSSAGSQTVGPFLSGTKTIKVTVTDSRGKKASKSSTVSVKEYGVPTAEIKVFRCKSNGTSDANGTYVNLTAKFSVNGKVTGNSISSRTLTSTDSVVTSSTLVSGTAYVLGAGKITLNKVYTFTLTVKDTIGNSTTVSAKIGVATTPLNARHTENGDYVGIMSYALYDGLTIGTDAIFDKDGNRLLLVGLEDDYDYDE